MAPLNRFGTRIDTFSRRGFLGGTGAALMIGLPMLESLRSRKARAAAVAGPPRLLCISAGNGLPMDELTPTATGANYTFNQGAGTSWGTRTIWKEFEPLRKKTSIITGLGIAEGRHDPGDHGCGMPAIFACTRPSTSGTAKLGITIDQHMANKYAAQTARYPTGLQLAMAKAGTKGDGPFGPTFLTTQSWKSATEPNTPTYNPQAAFTTMYAGISPKATSVQVDRTQARRMSILDYVIEEKNALLPALSKADNARMDQYFSAVRDFENTLKGGTATAGGAACAVGAAPVTMDYPSIVKAMADLVVLGLTCDLTRSVMFELSCYRNDLMYQDFMMANNPAVNTDHHNLSHSFSYKAADSGYRIVCRWFFDQIFYLVNKLDKVIEPNGLSILDNSLAIFNSDVGDGFQHYHNALPIVIWGSAGGKFPTGKYWNFPTDQTGNALRGDSPAKTPAAGLYVTMLNALGVDNVKTFGDTMSGPLALT